MVEMLKQTKCDFWHRVGERFRAKGIDPSEDAMYCGRDRVPLKLMNELLARYDSPPTGVVLDDSISVLSRDVDGTLRSVIIPAKIGNELLSKVTFRHSHSGSTNNNGSLNCTAQTKKKTTNYTISADYTGDERKLAIQRLAGLRKSPKTSQASARSPVPPSALGKRQFSSISRDVALPGERISLKRVCHG
jgi:hypothetical protein